MTNEILDIDPDEFTLEELCDFEETTGILAAEAFSNGAKIPAKAMVGIVWIVKRRTDPGFSFDDAKKLKLADIAVSTNGDE